LQQSVRKGGILGEGLALDAGSEVLRKGLEERLFAKNINPIQSDNSNSTPPATNLMK
jgi:hypothetical protein